MIKKISLCLCTVILLSTCKKENKPTTASYNIVGNWALYSAYIQEFGNLNVTSTQYPCIAGNVLTFNANSTSVLTYTGIDTCNITQPGGPKTTDGIPGQAPIASTWSLIGNTVYLKYPATNTSGHGVITSVNGKLYLTFTDTLADKSVTTTVDIKQ